MSDQLTEILEEVGRLKALADSELTDSQAEKAFDRLTVLATRILKAPISLISLVEPDRQFFKSQVGLPEPWSSLRETPISHSFCKHVVASSEPLIVEDARKHPLVQSNPAIEDLQVVSYLGVPLTSPDGLCLGSFCIIDHEPRTWSEQDIATMKTLGESVISEIALRFEVKEKAQAIKTLQKRNEDLDAFAHTVSHNLKNPISAITGWVSVSQSYAERMSRTELLETLGEIGELSAHTNDIINALLLLAGFNRNNDVAFTELNMFNIIDDALSQLRSMITQRGAQIHLPLSDTFPRSVGHRQWVEEVWVNYISNAIKYGGEPPIITFGADAPQDGFVRFWIQDNGDGLTPEQQKSLFIPFSRLPHTAKFEGHGLGLSIVQRIIEKLGGEVGVTSEPGKGSIFSFTLPQAD